MSVINDGNNLPGVFIDIEKEVASDFDTSLFGTTSSVLIIGTAFSGSPEVVFPIYGVDHAKYIYGNTYDSETRRTATLTAGIQDAYDRGCRTIYAMRVGGKDIYKDFKLRDDGKYFLRVSGIYPNNTMKNCYFRYDGRAGLEAIHYYKPASKSTISEKRSAVVDSTEKMIVNSIELSQDNGIGADDSLVDMINLFNSDRNNNVLRLSIVDEDGNDVTTSNEAYSICVGALFSGVYFIGRDASMCQTYTNLKTEIIIDDNSEKPYESFVGNYYKTLVFNSDVSEPYPIYASTYKELREILNAVSITSSSAWDFLEVNGLADRAFARDKNDYEEVDLSNFEIYKRLGGGFATTAHAIDRGYKEVKVKVGEDNNGDPIYDIKKVRRVPRVTETPDNDDNKIQGIRTGIYPMLQNVEVDFRVINCVNADDKIADKIPKAEEFKITVSNAIELLGSEDGDGALITATPIVDEKDTTIPKEYNFKFVKIDEEDIETDLKKNIYYSKVAEVVPGVTMGSTIQSTISSLLADGSVETGTKIALLNGSTATIIRITSEGYEVLNSTGLQDELIAINDIIYEGRVKTVNQVQYTEFEKVIPTVDATTNEVTFNSKTYMLIESAKEVFVAHIEQNSTAELKIEPLGDLTTMLGSNDEETLIYCENNYFNSNRVVIRTAATDFVNLEEFVALLNEHESLGRIFNFELTEDGFNKKDEYLEDIADKVDPTTNTVVEYHMFQEVNNIQQDGIIYTLTSDRVTDYDFSAYIPYKTTDNFARQLAHHCVSASFATYMTHGVIGISTLRDTSAKSIAKKVEDVDNFEFNMYAKKYNGRNMLGSDNMPYPVGSFISTTMFQYNIVDGSGYTFLGNGCTAYAGMVSNLPLSQSSTAQPINLSNISYRLTRDQLLTMCNKGIITARVNDTQSDIIITDGITMAPSEELKSRLSIQRIVNYIGTRLRVVSQPFLGQSNEPVKKNALKTAIDGELKSMEGTLISAYDFIISNLDTYSVDTQIDISFEIVPINEIRSINDSITVKRQLSSAA